ncbi:MAG TPA: SusC/RagA family TonB-linked outer membrane protein, partial [Gemmatimonadaceae bacterium]|nr:SusC/RagA family TonB-linked outer membrane protein [Gemmatimonadaceae bacterium]
RKEVTGSVASLSQAELTKVPTASVVESMQGMLPGVDITRSNGSPNSGNSLLVRGTRSLTASNNPLIIIDGVQFGSLSDLNPGDIESIEVLKDAASTAIYGSRGANGVILVTTKRGGANGTVVTANGYYGVTQITSYPRINTPQEYAALKREAYRTSGQWASPADDAKIFAPLELTALNAGVWTDFRDLIFQDGRTANQEISVMAGSDRTRAFVSGGYYEETGILRADRMRRYSIRINVDHTLSDNWKVGTATQLTYFNRDRRNDPLNMANKITPLTAAFDSAGALIVYPNGGKDISPLADEQPNAFTDNELQSRVLPSLYGELTLGGFSLRSTFGADISGRRRGIFASANTIQQNAAASAATYTTGNVRNFSFANVATYRRELGDHSLTLTGVGSYLSYKQDTVTASGRNQLLPSQLFFNLGGAREGLGLRSGYLESSLLSTAGRLNYDWRDRYLLSVTGRFDGSSRLSKGNQWAFFPAASVAWRMSEEPFMAGFGWLDDLKLRVGYGVSGNDAVDPYSTQASLISLPWSFDENLAPGYAFSSQIGNPNLRWELSRTSNVGLDGVFWNSRLSTTIDAYRTKTTDLLLQRFLPISSGVSSVVQNIGATETKGVELSLTSQNLRGRSASWATTVTFSRNREKIVSLVSGANDIQNGWFIGQPASVFYDYEKIGIWQLADSLEAKKFNQAPGDIRVKDQNGDGKITATDDRIVLGSQRPDWSGALTNNVSWKGFDVSATVFARMGQLMRYEYYDSWKPDGVENGAAVEYWTPERQSNAFPRPNSRFPRTNYLYYSTLTYTDGSFVKLRDATIGYQVPSSLLGRLSASQVRVYVSGRNLARWSEVPDYDPERGGSISSPMTRAFVTGLDVKF